MSTHRPRAVERHCDVAVVGGSAAGLAAALQLLRQRRAVIVVDDRQPPDGAEVRSYGGEILQARVTDVTRLDQTRFRVALVGGHSIVARRVIAAPGVVDPRRAEPFASLGVQVAENAGDGRRVADMISLDLAREDAQSGAQPSPNTTEWEHRYGAEQLWSGNPNGTLVDELRHVTPGRALDVGAGEGADAIWLAEHGWEVTANDVSQHALDRMTAEAERRNLAITANHLDANAPHAFGHGGFDLVTAMYASIPRTPDLRGVRNLIDAVAPGGTLLVVGHDLEPMREAVDTTTHSRAFDPDAYVRVEDVVEALAGDPGWQIELHERRPRPKGSATDSHHVDDVVLRARHHPGTARSTRSGSHGVDAVQFGA